ncbi:hypothetical protein [Granulicella arctica]|uniref:Uncharacterized protein n=1 Tax=Granulicella arctica TaxID=940613 RepID=A0A7Y9TTJ2_9BACT|nr:hypothetical protein [Granulicella arctica]NYF80023.1 hypothetical protein [Granulicella arctica]
MVAVAATESVASSTPANIRAHRHRDVAPVLANLTGASKGFVIFVLVLVGVGFTLGNGLGGRLADWSLMGATRIILLALVLIMVAMPLFSRVISVLPSGSFSSVRRALPSFRRCRRG